MLHPSSPANGLAAAPAQPFGGHTQVGRIEQRISDLRGKLPIMPAQSAQWEQFAQVTHDNAQSIDAAFDYRADELPGMTAPEHIQSYAALAKERAQEAQELIPAVQALYDTMSDSRLRRADQVFRDDASHRESARHGWCSDRDRWVRPSRDSEHKFKDWWSVPTALSVGVKTLDRHQPDRREPADKIAAKTKS